MEIKHTSIQGDSLKVSFNIMRRKNITNNIYIKKSLSKYYWVISDFWLKYDLVKSKWVISSINCGMFYYLPGPKLRFHLPTIITRNKIRSF